MACADGLSLALLLCDVPAPSAPPPPRCVAWSFRPLPTPTRVQPIVAVVEYVLFMRGVDGGVAVDTNLRASFRQLRKWVAEVAKLYVPPWVLTVGHSSGARGGVYSRG